MVIKILRKYSGSKIRLNFCGCFNDLFLCVCMCFFICVCFCLYMYFMRGIYEGLKRLLYFFVSGFELIDVCVRNLVRVFYKFSVYI